MKRAPAPRSTDPRVAALAACALALFGACGDGGAAPVPPVPVEPAPPVEVLEVSEVGAPAPIELPRGLSTQASEAAASGPTPAVPAVDEWAGTELREERFADGKPKLSRRVRRTDDGIENHGPFRKWATNGVLLEEGTFRAGEKDGPYVTRHESGLVKSEIHYRAGREHGRKREWGEYGVLLYEAELVDGQVDGEERTWWPDKNPRTLSTFRLGVLEGPSRVWHGNGVIAEEGQSAAGRREGTWTYRSGEDRLALVESYRAGALHGVTTEYDERLGSRVSEQPEKLWRSDLNPDMLGVLNILPEAMGITTLAGYIRHLGGEQAEHDALRSRALEEDRLSAGSLRDGDAGPAVRVHARP